MSVNLIFFPNKNKRDKMTEKIPLYLRVIVSRQKAEARLDKDFDLCENELLKWDPITMRFFEKGSTANDSLNEISGKFTRLKKEMDFNGKMFHPKDIVNLILGKSIRKEEILASDYLDKYFRDCLEKNNNYSDGTKRNYQKAITHFNNFLIFKRLQRISLKDFTCITAEIDDVLSKSIK